MSGRIYITGNELTRFENIVISNSCETDAEFYRKMDETIMLAAKAAERQGGKSKNKHKSVQNKDGKKAGGDKTSANKENAIQWIGGFDPGEPLMAPTQTETSFLDNKNYVENMHVSSNLLEYLKEWEGINGTINPAMKEYYDKVGKKWTIGYGHVESPAERKKYAKGITQEQANEILEQDIIDKGEKPVKELFKEYRFTQNEFDALVDLVFNSGPTTLGKAKALRALIEGHSLDKNAIIAAFEEITRRAPERKDAEGAMYTTGEYPSPSYLKK